MYEGADGAKFRILWTYELATERREVAALIYSYHILPGRNTLVSVPEESGQDGIPSIRRQIKEVQGIFLLGLRLGKRGIRGRLLTLDRASGHNLDQHQEKHGPRRRCGAQVGSLVQLVGGQKQQQTVSRVGNHQNFPDRLDTTMLKDGFQGIIRGAIGLLGLSRGLFGLFLQEPREAALQEHWIRNARQQDIHSKRNP